MSLKGNIFKSVAFARRRFMYGIFGDVVCPAHARVPGGLFNSFCLRHLLYSYFL